MSWETLTIADVGMVFDGPHATPRPADDGPIFLGIKNIRSDGHLDLSEVRHVSPEEFPRWTRRVTPQTDDIVFTYEATLHRYALIPEEFVGCLGRRVALVRTDPEAVRPRFLFYQFQSPAWRAQVEQNVLRGATVDRIPVGRFPDFEIRVPDVEIQDRIASVLSAYDDLIENNNRRMELLEEAIHLLFREWFIYLRFPGRRRVESVDGVPDGWRRRQAGEVIDFNPSTSVTLDVVRPYVPMASLSTTSMRLADIDERVPKGGAKFRNQDTLLARITPSLENGKTGFVDFLPSDEESATGSTEFIVMRGRGVPPTWVYCLARSSGFRQYAIQNLTGSDGRQRVSKDVLEALEILVPPAELLAEWERLARPMFEQVRNLTTENELLREARDLLLPRLMDGRIPV